MADSPLFRMQAPRGVPLSSQVAEVSDPLLPPQSREQMFAHFYPDLYDLRPESHLSRLLGVLLGDTGAGLLRKRYIYTHLSSVLANAHFYDIDRLFADVFGLKRFLTEGLPFDPYTTGGTLAEWEAAMAADASYRNRVMQFVHGVSRGGTVDGMRLQASAIIGSPVHIYEIYKQLDNEESTEGALPVVHTYEDLEGSAYADLDGRTYAALEGAISYAGHGFRNEFSIRTRRTLTGEERYHLRKIIDRMKPAFSMFSIDESLVEAYTEVPANSAYSDSEHWQIGKAVAAAPANAGAYPAYAGGSPVEQPKRAFAEYEGEEWFYNGDVTDVSSYALDEDTDTVLADSDYDRVVEQDTGVATSYLPTDAVLAQEDILRGRAVRDGVMVGVVAERTGL